MTAPSLGPDDLVLCSGTLPRGVPFLERVKAAATGGFRGLSLWARDYWAARHEGFSDADIRALLDDHGLLVAELDPVWTWLPGADRSFPEEIDTEEVLRYREDDLYRIADVVGARSLNAVDVLGGDWRLDDAAEAFAALCDRAAEHGLLVHVEFLPWSKIPDLASARRIVDTADRANGGLAIDSWHFFRSGARPDDLADVPGGRVLSVQVSDAPAKPEVELLSATLHERRLPGDGELDLTGFVGALQAIGAPAPIGVEIFSDELHARRPTEAAALAGDAVRRVLSSTPSATGRSA